MKLKMAPSRLSPLAMAAVISHITLALLLLDTRVELRALRGSAAAAAASHRELLEGSVGRMEMEDLISSEVDPLQAQLRALQERNDELAASVRVLTHQSADQRGRRVQTDGGAPHAPGLDPDTAFENVKIIKPTVVSCDTDPHACDGENEHRRAQSAEASCDSDELSWRTDDIDRECCDEPSEDCSSGYPRTCNAGCAALFLPFWAECRTALGKGSQHFEPVVAMCEAAASDAPSLARQLNVACSDGTPAAQCVPECCEDLHGSLMLLNIEGHDSKFACELRHGLYSWVGPAVRLPSKPPPLARLPLSLSPATCACFGLWSGGERSRPAAD